MNFNDEAKNVIIVVDKKDDIHLYEYDDVQEKFIETNITFPWNGSHGIYRSTQGDINGDGRTDLVVAAKNYNSSNQNIFILYYSESGDPTWKKLDVERDDVWHGITCGDVDGDGLDEIIALENVDSKRIFMCFLEYEEIYVKVHDILFEKTHKQWRMKKSFYRKLRIAAHWTKECLLKAGFKIEKYDNHGPMVTIVARK